jgi:TPR repeat protein
MTNIRAAALFLAGFLFASLPAFAGTKEAWDAYGAGDFAKAEQLARPEAEHGDADAQYLMGLLNSEGDLGPRNEAAASGWYQRAAEQGQADAENALGYQYDFGLGVPRDRAQARLWYDKAAKTGSVIARNNIAYEWSQSGERLDEALAYAREAVADDPKNGAYQDTLGWVFYRLKRFGEAVPPLCSAAKLDSGSPEIHSHLGDAFWHIGLEADARMQWQQALDITKTHQYVSREGEDFLYAEGDQPFEEAMKKRLAEGAPDGPAPTGSDNAPVGQAIADDCSIPTY